jgi:hypothetical protein
MIVSQRRISVTMISESGQVVVNGPDVNPQLEIDVSVNMSVSPTANSATVRILNLSQRTRQQLAGRTKRSIDLTAAILKNEQEGITTKLQGSPIQEVTVVNRGDAYVRIDAGYDNRGTALLFEGSTQLMRHRKDGPTWSTEMAVGDGLSTMMAGVGAKTFPPGTLLLDVVRHVGRVMSLDISVLRSPLQLSDAIGGGHPTFPYGVTLFDDARWFMSNMLEPYGAEWFVDRGQFFVVRKGHVLPEPAVEVDFNSGLLNQPEPGEDGTVRIRSIMRPDIRIGRLVRLNGVDYDGDYRVDNVMHRINNRQGDAVTEAFLVRPVTL